MPESLRRSRRATCRAENQLRSPAFSIFSISSWAEPSPRSRSHSWPPASQPAVALPCRHLRAQPAPGSRKRALAAEVGCSLATLHKAWSVSRFRHSTATHSVALLSEGRQQSIADGGDPRLRADAIDALRASRPAGRASSGWVMWAAPLHAAPPGGRAPARPSRRSSCAHSARARALASSRLPRCGRRVRGLPRDRRVRRLGS
jgi:hypothetical protein